MICSMTAFARQAGLGEWSGTVWEIRSVNHRFLEISLRLPEEFRGIETVVREHISRYLQRGKIDCQLHHNVMSNAVVSINMPLARQLAQACREMDSTLCTETPLNALELLRWPGVVEIKTPNLDQIARPLLELLDATLTALVETRRQEGKKLQTLMEDRCIQASKQIAILREGLPEIMVGLKQRLQAHAMELASGLDPGRLEQELLLLALKMDITEELDRLEIHVAEVMRILGEGGAVGRRLDFLLQEMNREANTIASKSAHVETTKASLELKVLIEQMREQVRNIE